MTYDIIVARQHEIDRQGKISATRRLALFVCGVSLGLLCLLGVYIWRVETTPGLLSAKPLALAERPYAQLRGNTIELLPSGATFQLPETWLAWHTDYQSRPYYDNQNDNFHLSRQQLELVNTAKGEEGKPYSAIVNAVLPFDYCAARLAARSAWGCGDAWDVATRVYVGALDPREVAQTVKIVGRRTAAIFASKDTIAVTSNFVGPWQRTQLQCQIMHDDYSEIDHIDFLTRTYGTKTVIIVFMYEIADKQNQPDMATILETFHLT